MCFSATVSFVTSLGLIIIGALSVVQSNRKQLMFAAIPLLFGIQQFAEGLLWIFLRYNYNYGISIATNVFLTFAFIIWPAWMPWSISLMEPNRYKKIFMKILGWIGIFWSLSILIILVINGSSAIISQGNIKYILNFPVALTNKWAVAAYLIITTVPMFISSKKGLWLFGIATIASCLISYGLWNVGFVSVWCFFAAILSTMIYLFIRANKTQPNNSIN